MHITVTVARRICTPDEGAVTMRIEVCTAMEVQLEELRACILHVSVVAAPRVNVRMAVLTGSVDAPLQLWRSGSPSQST